MESADNILTQSKKIVMPHITAWNLQFDLCFRRLTHFVTFFFLRRQNNKKNSKLVVTTPQRAHKTNPSSQQSGGHTHPHVTLVQIHLRHEPPPSGDPTGKQRKSAPLHKPRALSTATATPAPCDGAPRTVHCEPCSCKLRHEVSGVRGPAASNLQWTTKRASAPSAANSG